MEDVDLSEIDTRKLGIYYLDETQNQWVYLGGSYNAQTGLVQVETSHFTKFSVAEFDRSFTDANSSWAREYIEILAARHITKGINEENFGVGRMLSRAEFATFLVRAMGIDTGEYKGSFEDCKDGAWYTPYVEAAYREGLVKGKGNGRFGPDSVTTREEMAVLLMRAYRFLAGEMADNQSLKQIVDFRDMDRVSVWATDSVKTAQRLGLISGKPDGSFKPKDTVLREEAAKILIVLLELAGEM